MKIFFISLIMVFLLIIDFASDNINIVFFPKNIHRSKYYKEVILDINKDIKEKQGSFLLDINGKQIKSCKELEGVASLLDNTKYNKSKIEFFKEKCRMIKLMNRCGFTLNTKNTRKKFLSNFNKISSELVLTENCENDQYLIHKLSSEYKTIQDLIDAGYVIATTLSRDHIVFENKYDDVIIEVKEITRCAIKPESNESLILEIKIFKNDSKTPSCTLYEKYSAYGKNELLNKKQ